MLNHITEMMFRMNIHVCYVCFGDHGLKHLFENLEIMEVKFTIQNIHFARCCFQYAHIYTLKTYMSHIHNCKQLCLPQGCSIQIYLAGSVALSFVGN